MVGTRGAAFFQLLYTCNHKHRKPLSMPASVADHPFIRQPHRALITLSIPVTVSLVAEPVTAMVDTAFVASLGAVPLAALGAGATALTTILWIFNFLGVSTQTEVARALGQNDHRRASEITSLALILGLAASIALIAMFIPGTRLLTNLLGTEGAVQSTAETYIRIRLFGAPAILITIIGFGALRGLQDMRTPLWIAVAVNVLNIVLDGPFIFGLGPIPAMGAGGAALASIISQWLGTLWIIRSVFKRFDFVPHVRWADVFTLLRAGRDLFVRTGLLTLFILFSTRVANQISPEAGAAHQAIRSVWMFFALLMEGFAVTAQSLVGYFLGGGRVDFARRASAISAGWSLGTGVALTVIMLLGTSIIVALFVPPEAIATFIPAWQIGAFMQPLAALAFVTDGIHWGTGDYSYLRNGMIASTGIGAILLFMINPAAPGAFLWVWWATLIWVAIRAAFGMIRVWPGIGHAPLSMAP